jgi:exonuclease SbcC
MEALQARRMALERARSRAAEGERDLVRLAGQRRQIEDLATAARTGLSEAGFSDSDTADAPRLVSRIEKEWKALENARSAREQLEARLKQAEKDLGRLDAEVAAATARRGAARARLDELGVRRGAVVRALEEGAATLGALAGREGWRDLEALPTGRDEADAIEARREAAQRAVKELAGTVATLRATVRSIEQKLARVAELAARKAALEADSALLKTLADHLRADELVAWIQEEALARLAKDGSRHLARLSEGRYELRLGSGEGQAAARAEQDFFVVDHWNADGVRSVKTLSGGETFLASLSLSLALAESLAQLSAEGRAGDALESLFLDEGFGTLDAETLDTVVSALDALQGGERVVGIVTHVRELAERMPARLEVRRAGSTATATVV